MLSQTSEYALRAVLYLATCEETDPVKLDQIADALDAPRNYLSKTLHQLARAGVLGSGRGKHGGFWIAVPAAELTLAAIVAPFEPMTLARHCLLGEGECSDATACAVHDRWKLIAEPMLEFFRATTVAELMDGAAIVPGAAGLRV